MANTGTDHEPFIFQDPDDEDYTWPPRGHTIPPTPPRTLPQQVGAEFAALERRVAYLERLVHRLLNAPAPVLAGSVTAEQ